MLKLLHHPLNHEARRARLVMNEKNIAYDLEEVRYWERDDSFMEINPAGTIPVLIEEKGKPICGVVPVCEYLEEAYDARNLMGRHVLHKAETRRLVDWFGDKLYREVTKNLVWEKYFKKLEGGSYPNSQALAAGRANIGYHMEYIEFLTKTHRWLCGDEITLADLTAAAQLSVLDYFGDVPWENYKAAKKWYIQMKSRPSFSYLLNDKIAGIAASKNYTSLDF